MRFQCSQCQCVLDIDDCQPGELVACGQCNSAVTVPPSPTSPGSILGDFAIVREIGVGGMGTVYLAHQISLDRDVALKVLLPNFAEDVAFIQNFINEARAAASVNHPNIVQAYAVNSDQGLYYFAMEFVDGPTLKELVERDGPLPVKRVLDIAGEILAALDYAWQSKKIIHRDIKPDNIMITSGGQTKLADLGLARKITETNPDGSSELYGTPLYIAPELLFGLPASPASDIYGLGATLYHILTGQTPYVAEQPEDVVNLHIFQELPPLASLKPDIPAPLAALIETMLAKRPVHRQAGYKELLEDLQRVKNNEMPLQTPAAEAQLPLNPELADPLELTTESNGATNGAVMAAPGAPGAAVAGGKLKFSGGKKKFSAPAGASGSPVATDAGTEVASPALTPAPAVVADGQPPASATGTAGLVPVAVADGSDVPASGKRPVALIAVLVLILLAAGGGGAWYFLFRGSTDAASESSSAGSVDSGVDRLARVKAMIAEEQTEAAILSELNQLAAEITPDSAAYNELVTVAAPLVEKSLLAARQPAIEEKQQLWDRQVAAAKLAVERKAQEEAVKAEEAKKLAEEEKAQKAAEQAEQERQQELAEKKQELLLKMLEQASKQDYDAAQRLFASMAEGKAEQEQQWAKQWVAIIGKAETIHGTIRNSGTTFAEVDVNMADKRKWKIAEITFDKIKITSTSIAVDSRGKDRKEVQTMILDLRYLLPPQLVNLGREAGRKAGWEGAEVEAGVAAYLLVRGAALNTVRRSLEQIDGTNLILEDLDNLNNDDYVQYLINGLEAQEQKQGVLMLNYIRSIAPDKIENVPEQVIQKLQK